MAASQQSVAVIGGGVVGCATAHALARRGVAALVLEAEPGLALGASGANSGILHTGFDSEPGELETRLILRSAALREEISAELGVPLWRCGARLRPSGDEERAAVRARRAKSRVRRQEAAVDELSDAEGLNGDRHEQLDDRTIDAELAGRSVLEVVAAALKDLGIADPDLTVFAEPASALTPALSRDAGEGAVAVAAGGMPLARVAGEGGARRDGDGRVRPEGHDPPSGP